MNLPKDPNNNRFQWMDMLEAFLRILILAIKVANALADLFDE
jgi:hypothetical protein